MPTKIEIQFMFSFVSFITSFFFVIDDVLYSKNLYNDNTVSFTSYSIGAAHSCYINNNYKMKCFGRNTEKQLGLGDVTDHKGDGINGF